MEKSLQQHINNDRDELDNPNTSSQRRRHLEGELDALEQYQVNHPDDDISDVTRSEANCIAGLNSQQKFYFQDGNGYLRELLISDVNKLSSNDCLRSPTISGQFTSGVGNGDSDSTLNSAVEQANDPAINQLLDKAKIDIPADLGDF